jgi:hypothetical protein
MTRATTIGVGENVEKSRMKGPPVRFAIATIEI